MSGNSPKKSRLLENKANNLDVNSSSELEKEEESEVFDQFKNFETIETSKVSPPVENEINSVRQEKNTEDDNANESIETSYSSSDDSYENDPDFNDDIEDDVRKIKSSSIGKSPKEKKVVKKKNNKKSPNKKSDDEKDKTWTFKNTSFSSKKSPKKKVTKSSPKKITPKSSSKKNNQLERRSLRSTEKKLPYTSSLLDNQDLENSLKQKQETDERNARLERRRKLSLHSDTEETNLSSHNDELKVKEKHDSVSKVKNNLFSPSPKKASRKSSISHRIEEKEVKLGSHNLTNDKKEEKIEAEEEAKVTKFGRQSIKTTHIDISIEDQKQKEARKKMLQQCHSNVEKVFIILKFLLHK